MSGSVLGSLYKVISHNIVAVVTKQELRRRFRSMCDDIIILSLNSLMSLIL